MKAFFRRLGLAVIIICLAYALIYYISYPRYTYRGAAPNMGFDRYYAMKLAESAKLGVRPGNQEKLVRFSPGGRSSRYSIFTAGARRAPREKR